MSDFRKPRRGPDMDAPEPDQEGLKQRYTSHWDLDYLPRQEMEALMQRRATGGDRRQGQGHGQTGVRHVDPGRMDAATTRRGAQRAAMLLALAALGMVAIGYLILRL